MTQSRAMSAVEALANVCVGWCVALGLQLLLFPVIGAQVTLAQNLALSAAFTMVSLIRSYLLRRLFTAIGQGA